MKQKKLEVVELDIEDIERIVDIIQEDLDMDTLDIEQKDSLERLITLTIGSYFMILREKNCRTTKLTQ